MLRQECGKRLSACILSPLYFMTTPNEVLHFHHTPGRNENRMMSPSRFPNFRTSRKKWGHGCMPFPYLHSNSLIFLIFSSAFRRAIREGGRPKPIAASGHLTILPLFSPIRTLAQPLLYGR
jgi:hypothetical protein